MFSEICTIYVLDLWMGRSGRRSEGREVTGRVEPCLHLGSGWAWVQSNSAIPQPSETQINTHTHTPHLYTYTPTLIVKPLLIKAARLVLQSLMPLLICPALVETHICEYFSSAVSASQQAAEQKGLDRRWVEAGQRRYEACVPQPASRKH